MARLRLIKPDGEQVFLLSDEFRVGRLASNDLALPDDAAVSREHARLERTGSRYLVRDLDSSNGTFVERGEQKWRVDGELPLEPGDVIHVGAARLAFEDPGAKPSVAHDPGVTVVPGQTVVGRVLPVPVEPPEESEDDVSADAEQS